MDTDSRMLQLTEPLVKPGLPKICIRLNLPTTQTHYYHYVENKKLQPNFSLHY